MDLLTRMTDLETQLERTKLQLTITRNLMLIRQLATCYQFNAASLLQVGRPGRLFCMTHKDLSQSVKTQNLQKQQAFLDIEQAFMLQLTLGPGMNPTQTIDQLVKQIRELGGNNSHPTKKLEFDAQGNAVESPATYQDLSNMIASLKLSGVLQPHDAEDALVLLDVINRLKLMPGAPAGDFLRSV